MFQSCYNSVSYNLNIKITWLVALLRLYIKVTTSLLVYLADDLRTLSSGVLPEVN